VFTIIRRYGTLAGFVLLIGVFWLLLPGTFVTGRNVMNILQQVSMLAVVAFVMTVVMAMGDFDLSVGSMASLAGITAAITFRSSESVMLGIFAALAVGAAGGLLNGALVSYLGILPFVATLGTLTIFSGLAFLMAGGKTIFGSDIPAAFSGFARGGIHLWQSGDQSVLLPSLTLVAALCLAVVWFGLEKLAFGRHLYAMGGTAEAARLAGVRIHKLRLMAFAFSGLGASIAGLMYVSRVASANPTQGAGLMLDAIAAVFLGMTISRHGEPRVLNTLLGVLILGILNNGLTQLSIDSYIRDVLVGTLIIVAVTASSLDKLKRQ
jgi:ribose transport system permease protein